MTTRDVATLGIRVDAREVRDGDQALDDFSRTGARAEQQTDRTNAAFERMSKMAKAVAGALAAMEIYEYVKEVTLLASRYNELGVVMGVLGRNAGLSGAQLAATEAELRKTGISALQSRDAIGKLISANIDLSKATALARLAQDAAVIAGTNSSEAFSSLVKGIQSAEKETLQTLGLNVNFQQSYEKLAKSIGKKTDALTESEKTQAAVNAALEKAPAIAGAYEASLTNAGKQMRSMSRYAEDLKVALGQPFQNPFGELIDASASALKFAAANVDKIRAAIQMLMDAMGPALKVAAAYFALFVAAPAIYTAVAASVWKLVSAMAVYAMNVAIGQANTIGLNTALFGTSVAARLADGSLTKLGLAANVLFAAFAGWQIGTYLDEQFVQVRVAGEIMAGGLLEAWERIKFGGKVAFDALFLVARTTIQGMQRLFADWFEVFAKGLRLIGKEGAADKVDAFAGRLRSAADAQGTFGSRTAEARAEMVKNIKVIDQDTDRRIQQALVASKVSEATQGERVIAKKAAEEKKEQTDAQKKAYDAALKQSQDFLKSLKNERQEIGATDAQVRMLAAARAAAAVPNGSTKKQQADAAALRMEIMQTALAIVTETEAQAELDRVKASAKANTEALQSARAQEYLGAMNNIAALEREIATYGMGAEAINRYNIAQLQKKANDQAMTGDEAGYANTQKLIEAEQIMLRLNGQKDALDNMFETSKVETFGDALRDAFGSAGSAIGKLSDLLGDYNADSTKYDKARAAASKKYEGDEKKVAREIDKINEAQFKERIGSYADMAGAAKGFFKENTTGYKLMEGAERAFRALEFAMQMESLYNHLFVTTAKATGTVSGQAVETGAVVAGETARNAAKVPGVIMAFMSALGPWGMAAAGIAIAAVLGGAFSGSGGGVSTKITAEGRQKTQNRGTVLGDDSAQSESIANSLELMESYAELELGYQNSMLTALRNIESALGSAAKGVMQTVGITGGSAFGTKEFVDENTFSASHTKEITDSGIKLSGTFGQIRSGRGSGRQYEDVYTTSDGGMFHSGWERTDTNYKNLTAEAMRPFAQIYDNMGNLMLEAGMKLGHDGKFLTDAINNTTVDFGVSLRGLAGDDLTAAINAGVSASFDKVALQLFPFVEKFQKAGEGMGETLVRVAADVQAVDAVFAAMGKTTQNLTYEGREELVAAAGGLDKFADSARAFTSNFYSEAEQLAMTKARLAPVLAPLGLTTEGANAQKMFRDLVVGLDTSTLAGRKTYVALMEVQQAFYDVTGAVSDQRADLQDQLDEITLSAGGMLAKQRAAIDASNRALFDQVHAAEAQKEANEALRESMTDAVERFKDHARSLREFGADLMTGNLSTLTLEQQAAEAQSQYSAIAEKALAGDEVALGKFQEAAQKFLQLSQQVNGGDSRYSSDYAAVLAMTEKLAKYSDSRVDSAAAQIAALDRVTAAAEALADALSQRRIDEKATTTPGQGTYVQTPIWGYHERENSGGKPSDNIGVNVGTTDTQGLQSAVVDSGTVQRQATMAAATMIVEAVKSTAPRRSPRAESYAELDR